MGLIVGEGSFTGGRHTSPHLAVRLHECDPQPLEDLRSVLGGKIYGPYLHDGRRYRMWLLRGWQLAEALPYFDDWLPSSHKREQYEIWRAKYARTFQRWSNLGFTFYKTRGPGRFPVSD